MTREVRDALAAHRKFVARRALALAVLLSLVIPEGASGQLLFPREPEEDNEEYVLDAVTNDYNRQWREGG